MISIIMPTYNRPEYIQRAVNSVLEQTYKDFELIIVDDNLEGSDAHINTQKIITSYNDDRVKYIKNKGNLGGALSRNVGIFAAKDEYITFLDDDDMYLPDRLEIQLKEMIKNDWDFSVMDGATYDISDNKIAERHQKLTNSMSKEELIKVNLIYHISGTNTFMFRTEFLRSINGYDNVPAAHEFFLIQKTIINGAKIGYIPRILIKNYMHGGEQLSKSHKKIEAQKILINEKKRFFYLLTKSEERYVMCRYHGVLFFVHFRNKNYFKAFIQAISSFFTSPKQAYIWYLEYKKKIVY